MSTVAELACSYAAMILQDDGITVTAEKINILLKAANVKVDSFWSPLFAKLFEKRSVNDLIASVGSGGGGGGGGGAAAPVGAAATAPAAEAPKAEEKEEPKEESDDDMGFSLFD